MADTYHITDPEYWRLDRQDRDAMIHQIADTPPEGINPERALEASIMAMQDVGRTCEVMELIAYQVGRLTIAVEQLQQQPAPLPKPRGRPPQRMVVRANPQRNTVHFEGKRMTPERARELGNLLLNAADVAEGNGGARAG